MRIVEFRNLLDEKNALRVEFDQGKAANFVVQLECRFPRSQAGLGNEKKMPNCKFGTPDVQVIFS